MAAMKPDETILAAIESLQAAQKPTDLLKTRLNDPAIRSIVGPWPIDDLKDNQVEALIGTRALMLETLELMMLANGTSPLIKALTEHVTEASQALNSKGVGLGGGGLSPDFFDAIIGRIPPK